MARDTCRYPSCDRPVGQQDRDDYRRRQFCSVQCETKYEHVRADAREQRRTDHREARHDRAAWARRQR